MSRLRERVDRAWPKMSITERDMVAVTYFAKGLRDATASQMVSSLAQGSVGEALRVAANVVSNKQNRYGDQRAASSNSSNNNNNTSRPRTSRGRFFSIKEAEDALGVEIDPDSRSSGTEGAESADESAEPSEESSAQLFNVLAQQKPRSSSQSGSRAKPRAFGSQPRQAGAVVPKCFWCEQPGHWWQSCVSLRDLWRKLVKFGIIAPPSMRDEAKSDASGKPSFRFAGVESEQEASLPMPEDALEQVQRVTGVPALPKLDHVPAIAGRVTK
jgi:hypothetical protein